MKNKKSFLPQVAFGDAQRAQSTNSIGPKIKKTVKPYSVTSVYSVVQILFFAVLLAPGMVFAQGLSKEKMVEILRGIDLRIRSGGDYKALVYLEQHQKDKPDIAQEALVYRRDADQKLMILFTKPKTDAGKGYLAVWIAGHYTNGSGRWMIAPAVAAVAGHIFPVWLGFKGGKGVATSLGAFLPISAGAVAAAGALWVLVVLFWRYSSLGSIVAAASLPALVYLFYAPRHAPPTYVLVGTVVISLLVLAKHQANIRRLIAGTESRLGSRR